MSYNIYAKWTPKTYTIHYNANGGTVSPTSFTKTYETPYTENLAEPTKLDTLLPDGIEIILHSIVNITRIMMIFI